MTRISFLGEMLGDDLACQMRLRGGLQPELTFNHPPATAANIRIITVLLPASLSSTIAYPDQSYLHRALHTDIHICCQLSSSLPTRFRRSPTVEPIAPLDRQDEARRVFVKCVVLVRLPAATSYCRWKLTVS